MSTTKVLPMAGTLPPLPQELVNRLLLKGKGYGIEEVIPIRVSDIQVANWVQLKCRYGCQRFNQSWCCPPATPHPDDVRAILREYAVALLLVSRQKEHPDFRQNNANRKRIRQVQYWKGPVALERLLFLAGYYKSFSLVSVCCALCKRCAYPEDCRFPQEKRPSLESFSIDVFGTLRTLNRPPAILQEKGEAVSLYSMILVE